MGFSHCLPVLLLLPNMAVLSEGFDFAPVVKKNSPTCISESKNKILLDSVIYGLGP